MFLKTIVYILIISQIFACKSKPDTPVTASKIKPSVQKTIIVQPFSDVPTGYVSFLVRELKKVYPNVVLSKAIPLPKSTLNDSGSRYRADSLLVFLRKRTALHCTTIGVTTRDISATKSEIPDWGVMGLSYRPGNACIVSSYRLKGKTKLQKFFKLSLHELGHTRGLKHCSDKKCIMRSAEGKDHFNELNDFCSRCKKLLEGK